MTVPAFFPADVRIIRTCIVQKKCIDRKIRGKNLFIEKSADKKNPRKSVEYKWPNPMVGSFHNHCNGTVAHDGNAKYFTKERNISLKR